MVGRIEFPLGRMSTSYRRKPKWRGRQSKTLRGFSMRGGQCRREPSIRSSVKMCQSPSTMGPSRCLCNRAASRNSTSQYYPAATTYSRLIQLSQITRGGIRGRQSPVRTCRRNAFLFNGSSMAVHTPPVATPRCPRRSLRHPPP